MNRTIYLVLWGGVLLSMAVVLVGLAAKAFSPAPFPQSPTRFAALPQEIVQLTPGGLLSLGVLLMIFTPFVRVLLTVFVFAQERDAAYVGITGLVFLNLMLGVIVSLVFGVG